MCEWVHLNTQPAATTAGISHSAILPPRCHLNILKNIPICTPVSVAPLLFLQALDMHDVCPWHDWWPAGGLRELLARRISPSKWCRRAKETLASGVASLSLTPLVWVERNLTVTSLWGWVPLAFQGPSLLECLITHYTSCCQATTKSTIRAGLTLS